MDIEKIRAFCLALPNATEDVKWGADLCFCIGGKLFTVMNLNPPHGLSFKVTPEEFEELTQREGIKPADYVARYHWITILDHDVLRKAELEKLMKNSYDMVKAKLPKKLQGTALRTSARRAKKKR